MMIAVQPVAHLGLCRMNSDKTNVFVIIFYKMPHGLVYAIEIVDYNIAGGQAGKIPVKENHRQVVVHQGLDLIFNTRRWYNNITIYLGVAIGADDIFGYPGFVLSARIKYFIIQFVRLFLYNPCNARKER